jgi:hypothetical protein
MTPAERVHRRAAPRAGRQRGTGGNLRALLACTLWLGCQGAAAADALDAEFLEFLALETQDVAQTRQDAELVAWLRDFWNPDARATTTAEPTEDTP